MKQNRLLVLGLLASLLTACSLPFGGGGATLTVSLQVEPALASPPPAKGVRSILPDTGISVATWNISGLGPFGRSFSLTAQTGTSHAITGLAPGAWTVSARGLDATGTIIVQSDSTQVALAAAESTPLALSCSPLSGLGSFGMSLSLPAGVAVNPAMSAIVTPLGVANPSDTDLAPVLNAETGEWTSAADLAAGWYVLRVRVTDQAAGSANTLLWSYVDTVRILKGRTSSVALSPNADDLGQPDNATLALGLQSGLLSGITVSITGHEDGVAAGSETVLTALADMADALAWQWYLDGTRVADASTSTWTLPETLAAGTRHWVTAVAYRAKGDAILESAGSGTASFTVTE